jgi:hypothetical protein
MGVLRVNVLGPPEVFHDESRLSFALRKAQALLLYLAVEGGLPARDSLIIHPHRWRGDHLACGGARLPGWALCRQRDCLHRLHSGVLCRLPRPGAAGSARQARRTDCVDLCRRLSRLQHPVLHCWSRGHPLQPARDDVCLRPGGDGPECDHGGGALAPPSQPPSSRRSGTLTASGQQLH